MMKALDSIQNAVLTQWPQGVARDMIAINIGISSGTVSRRGTSGNILSHYRCLRAKSILSMLNRGFSSSFGPNIYSIINF